MNRIVNGCDAKLTRAPICGNYFIDATESNNFYEIREVESFPVGTSCTYRVVSTCGYPVARVTVFEDLI